MPNQNDKRTKAKPGILEILQVNGKAKYEMVTQPSAAVTRARAIRDNGWYGIPAADIARITIGRAFEGVAV